MLCSGTPGMGTAQGQLAWPTGHSTHHTHAQMNVFCKMNCFLGFGLSFCPVLGVLGNSLTHLTTEGVCVIVLKTKSLPDSK